MQGCLERTRNSPEPQARDDSAEGSVHEAPVGLQAHGADEERSRGGAAAGAMTTTTGDMKMNARDAIRLIGACLAGLCLAIPVTGRAATFAKGADVSWVSQ